MKYFIWTVVVLLFYCTNSYAGGNGIRIVSSKTFLGHIVVSKKGAMVFYGYPDIGSKRIFKIKLIIQDGEISEGKYTHLSVHNYYKILNRDMSFFDHKTKYHLVPGGGRRLLIPVVNAHNRLSVYVRYNLNRAYSAFLIPNGESSLFSLGYGIPKSALLLSRTGNRVEVAIILLGCGNDDCSSKVIIVSGPHSIVS